MLLFYEVHLSHVFENEVNSYSGIGFQHTGTSGAGKSGNRVTIHSVSVDYKGVTGEVIDVPDNDINNGNDDINKDTDDRILPILKPRLQYTTYDI